MALLIGTHQENCTKMVYRLFVQRERCGAHNIEPYVVSVSSSINSWLLSSTFSVSLIPFRPFLCIALVMSPYGEFRDDEMMRSFQGALESLVSQETGFRLFDVLFNKLILSTYNHYGIHIRCLWRILRLKLWTLEKCCLFKWKVDFFFLWIIGYVTDIEHKLQ